MAAKAPRASRLNVAGSKTQLTRKQWVPRGYGYELYDLLTDPRETRNLASEKPKVVSALSVNWRP